jgi:hypothetical protein
MDGYKSMPPSYVYKTKEQGSKEMIEGYIYPVSTRLKNMNKDQRKGRERVCRRITFLCFSSSYLRLKNRDQRK